MPPTASRARATLTKKRERSTAPAFDFAATVAHVITSWCSILLSLRRIAQRVRMRDNDVQAPAVRHPERGLHGGQPSAGCTVARVGRPRRKGKAEGEGAGTVQPSVIRVGKIKNHDGLSCESHTMGLSRRTEALKPNTEQFRGPQSSALSSQSLCA